MKCLLFTLLPVLCLATSIPVHSGDDLQVKVNSSSCSDSVVLDAGVTWDLTLILPNHNCTMMTPTTIITSASSMLPVCVSPTSHVSPTDSFNMPRIRTLGGGTVGAAIELAPGANYWTIDGIELTDNAPTNFNVSTLIDAQSAKGVGNLIVRRSYMHQKETGTNYNRTVQRAIWFEAPSLLVECNYVGPLVGYFYPDVPGIPNNHTLMNTEFLLSISGSNMLARYNYVDAWYNAVFTGGADSLPQNSATLSSASTSAATFSNTVGVATDLVVRLGVQGTLTLDSVAKTVTFLTQTTPPISNADIAANGASATIELSDSAPSRILQLCTSMYIDQPCNNPGGVVGNVSAFFWTTSSTHPVDGTYNYTLYQTAQVTSVAGNVVSYTPNSHDKLLHTPQVAAWNFGTQGNVHDVTLQGNTFYVDPAFGVDAFTQTGNCPKGAFEMKSIDTFNVIGNRFIGYPAILAAPPTNQNGTSPWTTTRNITIQSNWIDPITPSACKRAAANFIDHEDLHTISPSNNNRFVNNFMGAGIQTMLSFRPATGNTWSMTHNTAINTVGGFDYNGVVAGLAPVIGWTFSDNIADYNSYGMQCFTMPFTVPTCYPSGVFLNNVIVDTQAQGFGTNIWGTGSVLAPIPTAFSQVGFTDMANQIYNLASTSPYKGKGSDGKDPGVDWAALQAALGGVPIPIPTPNHPPTLTITAPVQGSKIKCGTVNLKATAKDLEDGDITAKILWSNGAVGGSTTMSYGCGGPNLGLKSVNAAVVDSGGLSGASSVQYTIVKKL